MSISGIANTALSSLLTATQSAQNGQGNFQQIHSEFPQLGQDLQPGNLTQAQQDFATIQQDFQQQQQQEAGQVHHHHHHGGGGGGGQPGSQVSQALNSLSSALQAGNLSSAQTAFAALEQDLEQFSTGSSSGSTSGSSSSSTQTSGSGLNVAA
jgi:hypothetical protein